MRLEPSETILGGLGLVAVVAAVGAAGGAFLAAAIGLPFELLRSSASRLRNCF